MVQFARGPFVLVESCVPMIGRRSRRTLWRSSGVPLLVQSTEIVVLPESGFREAFAGLHHPMGADRLDGDAGQFQGPA